MDERLVELFGTAIGVYDPEVIEAFVALGLLDSFLEGGTEDDLANMLQLYVDQKDADGAIPVDIESAVAELGRLTFLAASAGPTKVRRAKLNDFVQQTFPGEFDLEQDAGVLDQVFRELQSEFATSPEPDFDKYVANQFQPIQRQIEAERAADEVSAELRGLAPAPERRIGRLPRPTQAPAVSSESILSQLQELERGGVEGPDAASDDVARYRELQEQYAVVAQQERDLEQWNEQLATFESERRMRIDADRVAQGLPPIYAPEQFPGPSAEDIAAAQPPTVPGGPQFSQEAMVSRQANIRPADLRTLEQQPIPEAIPNDQFSSFLNNLYGRGGEDQLVAQEIAQQAPDLFRQFQAQTRARNERAASTREFLASGGAQQAEGGLQPFQQQVAEFKPQPGLYSAAQLAGEPALDFGSFLETLASDTGFRQNLRASRQGSEPHTNKVGVDA
jgi:hypothetical protein